MTDEDEGERVDEPSPLELLHNFCATFHASWDRESRSTKATNTSDTPLRLSTESHPLNSKPALRESPTILPSTSSPKMKATSSRHASRSPSSKTAVAAVKPLRRRPPSPSSPPQPSPSQTPPPPSPPLAVPREPVSTPLIPLSLPTAPPLLDYPPLTHSRHACHIAYRSRLTPTVRYSPYDLDLRLASRKAPPLFDVFYPYSSLTSIPYSPLGGASSHHLLHAPYGWWNGAAMFGLHHPLM